MMSANMIPFATRAMGYDPNQVNLYFQKLTGEYGNLQHSYTELSQKYDALVKQSNSNQNAIAKAIIDAEAHAMSITEGAKAEANKIINDARRDAEAVRNAKALLSSEINNIVHKLQSMGM